MPQQPLTITLATIDATINWRGGAEKILCLQANALVERGHDVQIFCIDTLRQIGRPAYPLDPRVRFIQIDHEPLPVATQLSLLAKRLTQSCHPVRRVRRARRQALHVARYTAYVQHALQRYPSDIVITYQPLTSAILEKAHYTGPLISMLHLSINAIKEYGYWQEARHALSTLGPVQVLMPAYCEPLRGELLPGADIVCIGNPVDRAPNVQNIESHKILNVARLSTWKRQHLLIEAAAILDQRLPTLPWHIECWGEAPKNDDYVRFCQQRIQALNIGHRIRICGTTDDVPALLKTASIIAMPSLNEGFSLALTEAMAAGLTPVVSNDCVGMNFLVQNEVSGLVIDKGDATLLAQALHRLLTDDVVCKHLGHNARESMRAFAPEAVWDQWEALITKTVKNHT